MWATAPLIITMATPIPRVVNSAFQNTVLGNNLSYVLSNIFSYAMIGILVSLIVSLLMLPKPPKGIWYRIKSVTPVYVEGNLVYTEGRASPLEKYPEQPN